jgi:hypothetical protein
VALYNNGYRLGSTPFRSGLGALTTIYNGGGSLFRNAAPTGRMRASAMTFGEYNAFPNGNLHPVCWMLPQKAGGMSMRPRGEGSLAANLIPTRPMSIDMTGSGDLAATAALVVSMACAMTGSGSLTATITGLLDMTCDMAGSGDLAADMEGIASMAIDMLGQGDLEATIAAYGDMTIDIVVTGTGLSTANVGAAVWNALAASFNDAGTMGNKLNTASSGGVDYGALADAVRTELGVELDAILEVWRRHGLDIANPLTQTTTSITAGDIDLEITGDPDVSVTVTRQP